MGQKCHHGNQRRREGSNITLASKIVCSLLVVLKMSDSEEDDLVESVVEPYLSKAEYTDLELVEFRAGCTAAASRRKQSTFIPLKPVPRISGDWWCSCGVCVIMPTEVESYCPPLEKKEFKYTSSIIVRLDHILRQDFNFLKLYFLPLYTPAHYLAWKCKNKNASHIDQDSVGNIIYLWDVSFHQSPWEDGQNNSFSQTFIFWSFNEIIWGK